MLVTIAEYRLRQAQVRLQTDPRGCAVALQRALAETRDPRLAWRIEAALTLLRCGQREGSLRWLRRALDYERLRHSTARRRRLREESDDVAHRD